MRKAIKYQGKDYASLAALARELELPVAALTTRVKSWPEEHWGKPLGFRLSSLLPKSEGVAKKTRTQCQVREYELRRTAQIFPDVDSVVRGLIQIMEVNDLAAIPTAKEMRRLKGGSLLVKGIQRNGGLAVVAKAAGLELESYREHQSEGRMREWSYFREKLLAWINRYGTPGVMPTSSQLKGGKGFGGTLLSVAGTEFGGMKTVAQTLGLEYTYQTCGKDWGDIEVVKSEILAWNKRHQRPLNILPTATDLQGTPEDRALHRGIRLHGYFPEVAVLLELEFHGRNRRCGIKNGRHTRTIKADYSFTDLPDELQQMAISLATSLGITSAQAWAQIVERLPVEVPPPESKPAPPGKEAVSLAEMGVADGQPVPIEVARQWLEEVLGIPKCFGNQEAIAALIRLLEEDGYNPLQVKMRLGLLPSQFEQLKKAA